MFCNIGCCSQVSFAIWGQCRRNLFLFKRSCDVHKASNKASKALFFALSNSRIFFPKQCGHTRVPRVFTVGVGVYSRCRAVVSRCYL